MKHHTKKLDYKLINYKLLPSAVPAYGSDKLPRLTYSIAPQFGNRGTSRSDVKT